MIANIIIFAIQLLANIYLTFKLFAFKMLPNKYALIVTAVLAIFQLGTGLLLFFKNKKRHIAKTIIGGIAALLALIIAIYVGAVLDKVDETVEVITTPRQPTTVMAVYVMKEDPATSINDAADYTFGYINDADNKEVSEEAVAQINTALNIEINTITFTTSYELVDALYASEVNAIIMNTSYEDFLRNTSEYRDFRDRVRHINDAQIVNNVTPVITPVASQIVTDEPFTMYVCGSDSYDNISQNGARDVNILLIINPQTNQMLIIQTPHSTYLPNPMGNNELDKLQLCGLYGPECSAAALGNLYDIDVNGVYIINYAGMTDLIDTLGGINMLIDSEVDGVDFPQGNQRIDGATACTLIQAGGAVYQTRVIKGVFMELMGASTITNIFDILDAVQNMFFTTFTADELYYFANAQLANPGGWSILTLTVPGDRSMEFVYTLQEEASVTIIPEERIEQVKTIISRMLNGERISESDLVLE